MISSLVRWFESRPRSRHSGHDSGAARRFTPLLDILESRTLAGGLTGGVLPFHGQPVLLGSRVGSPSPVSQFGSKPGGAGDGIFSVIETSTTRSSGEEIPQ